MDSLNIVAVACIIFMLLAIIIAIIIAMTSKSRKYIPQHGITSRGSWKLVATNVGALPSYYFIDRYLINDAGQYLMVNGNTISLTAGTPAKVTVKTPFIMINELYLNLDENGGFILEESPRTTWLFDSYNFYLTKTLTGTSGDIISSLTGTLTTVSNPEIYLPPTTFGKWTLG